MFSRSSCLVLGWLIVPLSGGAQDAGTDFFERKIRPVLVEHCYSCHSADAKKQRGGLLLDTKEALLKGGDSGPALAPRKPKESLLLKALHYDDPELRMPPKGKLSDAVIADFEKWIDLGAPDPRAAKASPSRQRGEWNIEAGQKFWAFQPPKLPAPPTVKDTAWPKNDIDRFILAKLESKGLRPVGDAAPAVLLRRLHFVLIGLPPTPQEIDDFVKDCQSAKPQAAVISVVDRLLASPHFGERWGRHWLDVARFAESSGGGRSLMFKDAWRYRDYVIRSFNSDKPFTQFITEQLAGDLLDAKTPEERYWQLIATAFLLLGPTNFERQDKPILEMDVIDEQLDTLGKAFLGMTIGCARCHDHKFDPIPTRDYYAMAGILKSTKFIVHDNVSKWMTQPLPMLDAMMETAIKQHETRVAALKAEIKQVRAALGKAGLATVMGEPIDPAGLPGLVIDDSQAKVVGKWKHSVFTNHFVGKGYLYDDRANKGEKTVTFQPEFTKAGFYEVRLAYVPNENRANKVTVHVFNADGDSTLYVNQKKTPPIADRWISLGKFRFEPGSQWFVLLTTEGANGHVIADAVQFLSEEDLKAETKATPAPNAKDGKQSKLAQLEAELKRLEASAPERPLAMAVTEGDKIADIHIALRGNVHNKGDLARRGFLQVTLAPMGRGQGEGQIGPNASGRRELAAWIASPDNPLTARVFANRVWHHLIGAGLVRTVDNFGATGDAPSHPELLDYLAVRFVNEGWSIKKLIREIVLSRTFQQTSEVSKTSEVWVTADPENRLLWRMNRRRLDAETLRDTMLTISGQLDPTVYGNNIKKGTTVERDYVFADARRSIYAPVFRNRLHELFEVFDFPDPNMVFGKRSVSTVPTQALYLMNSPFVMDQAKATAERLLKLEDLDDERRRDAAYRLALGRLPTERERKLATAYVRGAGTSEQRRAAWERFCQTLLACVDFRYVN